MWVGSKPLRCFLRARSSGSARGNTDRLIRFVDQWNRWWFRQAPPHLLALFRILFGAFLLLYFGMQFPHVEMLYSREGLLMPLYLSDGLPALLFTPPSAAVATLLFTLFLLALLNFTIGFRTRASGAIALLFYGYCWILSLFQFGTSFDRLFLFTLLVLACSGCGRTFSVDMRLRRGSFTAWEPISILPQRLLAVQITVTYLGVGWQKLMLPAWQTGKVLAYAFVGRWATEPAWWLARQNIPLPFYDAAVWIIKAFELTIPFGLWIRRARWWFMAGGTLFHIGIAVLMGIWWFLALIPAYMLFFEPEEGEKVLGWR